MAQPRIDMIAASLERLDARLPDVPVDQLLIMRLILLLAHDFDVMLVHHIRPFGLGEGEFRVLTALFSQPQGIAHPTELCSRASQSPANMSRIADALVQRDLITRDSSALDRRRLVLRITAHGEQLVRNLLPSIFAAVRRIFDTMAAAQQQEMIAQIKSLATHLDAVTKATAAEPGI